MAEERLRIFIEWIEQHPKKYEDVIKKLEGLKDQYKAMKSILVDTTKPLEQQAKVHEAMNAVRDEATNKIIRQIPAVKMAQEAQKRMDEQAEAGNKKWEGIGAAIEKFGRKVGFTGFIVAFSVQRIIRSLQQFTKYFIDAIKATADWPDKLGEVAYAMGMLQFTGAGTSDTMKLLSGTMTDLASKGPTVQALWLGLNAVWTSVQTTLATALIPALTQTLAQLGKFLVTKDAQAALANLAGSIGSLFIALAGMAPMIIQLVTGFTYILNVIKPFLPIILPLVAGMLLLGMVCSVLGPILTVLGGVIGFIVKAKRWWMLQTNLNTVSMQRLKLSIVATIGSLLLMGIMLYAMSRTATAAATDVSNSFDKLGESGKLGMWTITDAQGNLMYSINTLTNEVSDASGNIIGYYNTMTGALVRSNGDIIGAIDQATNKFYGADGAAGTLRTGVENLSSALSKFDTSGIATGMNGLTDAAGGLTDQLGLVNIAFIAIGAISFVELLIRIGTVIAGIGGIGTAMAGTSAIYTYEAGKLVAVTGGLSTSLSGVLGMLSVAAPWVIGLTAAAVAARILKAELEAATEAALPGYKEIEKKTGFPVIPPTPIQGQMDLAHEIADAFINLGNWFGSLKIPGFQFGTKRVPKTGIYQLEKGEKVIPTREYGPEEKKTSIIENIVEMKKGWNRKWEVPKIEVPKGQFGVRRVPERNIYRLEKGETVIDRRLKEKKTVLDRSRIERTKHEVERAEVSSERSITNVFSQISEYGKDVTDRVETITNSLQVFEKFEKLPAAQLKLPRAGKGQVASVGKVPGKSIIENIVEMKQGLSKKWIPPKVVVPKSTVSKLVVPKSATVAGGTKSEKEVVRTERSMERELGGSEKYVSEIFSQITEYGKTVTERVETVNNSFREFEKLGKLPAMRIEVPRTPRERRAEPERFTLPPGEYGAPNEGTVATVVMPTPQNITISTSITIENVSTELDAERLADIINRQIAEGIRRKR